MFTYREIDDVKCPSAQSKKTGTTLFSKQDYHLSYPKPPFFRVSVTGQARALRTRLAVIEFIKFHERNKYGAGVKLLSPSETIATCQRKISQRNMLDHPVATCCDVLRHKGCCWLKFDRFQAPARRSQHFNATHRNIVGRSILQALGHPVATCCHMLGVVGSNLKMIKFGTPGGGNSHMRRSGMLVGRFEFNS